RPRPGNPRRRCGGAPGSRRRLGAGIGDRPLRRSRARLPLRPARQLRGEVGGRRLGPDARLVRRPSRRVTGGCASGSPGGGAGSGRLSPTDTPARSKGDNMATTRHAAVAAAVLAATALLAGCGGTKTDHVSMDDGPSAAGNGITPATVTAHKGHNVE